MSERSNPFEELERYFDQMSRQFEESSRSWGTEGPFAWWSGEGESTPIDLVERDDEFVVTVDLPGFERDDVDVSVTDHVLRIHAEREEAAEEESEEDGHYLRRERRRESARRSIRLPDEVDKEAVDAEMKHGVLTVTLPRAATERPHRIEID